MNNRAVSLEDRIYIARSKHPSLQDYDLLSRVQGGRHRLLKEIALVQ
jgi:hypothetical protein